MPDPSQKRREFRKKEPGNKRPESFGKRENRKKGKEKDDPEYSSKEDKKVRL